MAEPTPPTAPIQVSASVTQPTPDTEDITLHFRNLPAGRGQSAARLAADLSAALADGRLDLIEDLQLGIDVKALIRP